MPLWEEPCYHSNRSLHYLRDWLLENKDRFEDLSYDFYLFVTSRFTCDEENESDIGPVLEYDCNSTSTLVKSSGGLIQYDPFFSLHVTQMIADRFHINEDNVLNCGLGHIMDYGKIETCVTAINPRSWSNCSQSAFQSLPSTAEYLCYKMPAFKPDGEGDNDYQ
ncbi:uncharacterized protein LOC130668697 [Microplitis mediator]|uniref:uncharacterized protein LOC130668697 n=1 Tax=Microplitis mediator TaxID=375433 RepID=UPI0025543661|nr:uncharacterized protein LOC130668697 [Microplitis mediator]